MNRLDKPLVLASVIAALLLVMPPSRVQAITNGFPDTNNAFNNVGALIAVGTDGIGFQFCSGTLIAPTVFLTAAHCAHFFNDFLASQGFTLYMSFGNPIPILELTDVSTLIPVNQIIPNPKYVQATDTHPFNPHHGSDPGDLAVVILPLLSTRGITPATLPTLGLLDQLAAKNALHDAVFIAVGYGAEDKFGTQLNPVPRLFAFSSFSALEVGYLQLSINPTLNNGGDCFGDSGGPNFLQVNGKLILMATSSVGGDVVCRATSGDYRLDTATARDFLKDFVTLP
jgi:trypsin